MVQIYRPASYYAACYSAATVMVVLPRMFSFIPECNHAYYVINTLLYPNLDSMRGIKLITNLSTITSNNTMSIWHLIDKL